MFFYDQQGAAPAAESHFMYKVYGWMCAALAVTATTSFFVISSPSVAAFVYKPGVILGLCLGQLVLVIMLAAMIRKLSFATACTLFFVYAVSLGLTLSTIFMVYTEGSIYSTFIVTSGMFGSMAIYGAFTRTDLTSVGNYAIMALWGLILSMVVNIFLQSQQFDFLISLVGVAVFVLLTAVDSQKIKRLGQELIADRQTVDKVALVCALSLYLDFINLFLFLLRIMGQRKD